MKKVEKGTFLEAAKKNVEPSIKEALAIGETGWLRGCPISSDKGTLALKTRDGFIIMVSESDVVEIAQHEHEYFLRVKNGSDVVTRFESTNKLLPSKPEKSCDRRSETGTVSQRRAGEGPPDVPIIGLGCYQCWIEYVESWCELEGTGIVFKCYRPQIRCGDVCPPIIWT